MIQARVYPTINIHTQASGRHSTTDPPLTTLPDDLSDLVLPELGCIEWGYDWDSIELRIIASEAGDEPLLKAFTAGDDVHTMNACDIFGLSYPPNSDTYWNGKRDLRRRFAKIFVYRLLYGAKPETCRDIPGVVTLGLDLRGLIRASENWLNRHPAIRAYQRRLADQAAKTGQVYSFMGRRRTLQETGDEAARQAMNHPMQGGCMDVYEEVLYELDTCFYPTLRFRWGAHDSHKWDMSLTDYENDNSLLLKRAAAIVQQPRVVNNRMTPFPATFHVTYDDGRTVAWTS